MHDPGGFSLGNFLPGPFGIVSWCIIEMEIDTSKHLPMLAVARIPFDVRQNRCTKELRIAPHPGRQSKRTVDAKGRPNNGNQAFLGFFESEKRPSMEPKLKHEGTHNRIMTHRQFINVQSLSLWHGARPEKAPRKK
jgi:hypothetical protein